MNAQTLDGQLQREVVWFATAVELAKQVIVVARKPAKFTEDELWTMSLFGTLANLERHLNPRRLRFEDLERRGAGGSGVLRTRGLSLLKKGFDGVLTTFQLTPICHDGAIFMSNHPDAVPPAKLNCVRVDESAFAKSPKKHLDTMQEGCDLILQDIAPSLQQIHLSNVAAHVANAVAAQSSPPVVPPYLELKLDSDTHTVRRNGQQFAGISAELPATLCWPVFKRVFAKKGEPSSQRERKKWPGSDEIAARRQLRKSINDCLAPLKIEITEDWELVEKA